jgi:hypothetical protein
MNSEQAVRLISKVNKDTQDGSLSWHLESDEPSATYHNSGPIFSATSADRSLTFYLYQKESPSAAGISLVLTAFTRPEVLVVEDTESRTREFLSGHQVLADLYRVVRNACFPLDKRIRQYLNAE